MSSNPGHVDQAQALKTDPELGQAFKTDPDSSADVVADVARADGVADLAQDPKANPELAQVPKAEGTHFYFILDNSKQIIKPASEWEWVMERWEKSLRLQVRMQDFE